ncbi:MAG TPA: transcriptional repressor LexA [Candidatus Methylomirabilis sp.]|nr:transcriptional repressor LexA [Candidatus Methylomirabilis sp.]
MGARLSLTSRQREVLEFIRRFMGQAGYPPTVREIGAHFGFVPRSVFDHLKALERKGYLRRVASKSRSLQILDAPGASHVAPALKPAGAFRELPILGRVAAGEPLLSEQNIEGTFAISRDWVNGDEAFLLKVQGESMIGAHILPGDYAVVRRQTTAENGDIVVALLNDEATIKRVYLKKDLIVLQPENPAMPPIQVRRGDKTIQIVGKVIGILRRL